MTLTSCAFLPLDPRGDGGRYINIYGINIVRTPDGRWTNWSINRMMLADAKRLACLIPPNQHLGMIDAEWKQRGERTPIAVALGAEPGLAWASTPVTRKPCPPGPRRDLLRRGSDDQPPDLPR